MKITLEKAQGWVNQYGVCVDFCEHVTPETMANEPELFGYSEYDSFGPVVIAVHCKACEEKMKQADAELGADTTSEPVIGYDRGPANSWREAFKKAYEAFDNGTVKSVVVITPGAYTTGAFETPVLESYDAFANLERTAPQTHPGSVKFHLLSKWVTPSDKLPYAAFIIVCLQRGEKFDLLPDLVPAHH